MLHSLCMAIFLASCNFHMYIQMRNKFKLIRKIFTPEGCVSCCTASWFLRAHNIVRRVRMQSHDVWWNLYITMRFEMAIPDDRLVAAIWASFCHQRVYVERRWIRMNRQCLCCEFNGGINLPVALHSYWVPANVGIKIDHDAKCSLAWPQEKVHLPLHCADLWTNLIGPMWYDLRHYCEHNKRKKKTKREESMELTE